MKYYLDEEKTLHEAAKAAKAEPHKLAEKIQSMLDEIKALTAENEKLKDQIAKSEVADVMDQVVAAGDYKVLPVSVKDVDMNALRTLGDDLKDKIGSGVIILASDMGGKVNLIVTATDDAVKAGAIRHFFLVAGCDGARSGRNYYTDFVKQSPSDSVILTLACGKYRFNDLDLGTIGGLPRLMDMGQCNDAYGAIKVAGALAEAFGCGVNELPLSLSLIHI